MRTDQRMTMNIIWISMIKSISVTILNNDKKETRSSHKNNDAKKNRRKQHNARMSIIIEMIYFIVNFVCKMLSTNQNEKKK